jgi:hypothetical protein
MCVAIIAITTVMGMCGKDGSKVFRFSKTAISSRSSAMCCAIRSGPSWLSMRGSGPGPVCGFPISWIRFLAQDRQNLARCPLAQGRTCHAPHLCQSPATVRHGCVANPHCCLARPRIHTPSAGSPEETYARKIACPFFVAKSHFRVQRRWRFDRHGQGGRYLLLFAHEE